MKQGMLFEEGPGLRTAWPDCPNKRPGHCLNTARS